MDGLKIVVQKVARLIVPVVLFDNNAKQKEARVFSRRKEKQFKKMSSIDCEKKMNTLFFNPGELLIAMPRETGMGMHMHKRNTEIQLRENPPRSFV